MPEKHGQGLAKCACGAVFLGYRWRGWQHDAVGGPFWQRIFGIFRRRSVGPVYVSVRASRDVQVLSMSARNRDRHRGCFLYALFVLMSW